MNYLKLNSRTTRPARPQYGEKTIFMGDDGVIKVISGTTGLVTTLEENDGGTSIEEALGNAPQSGVYVIGVVNGVLSWIEVPQNGLLFDVASNSQYIPIL